MTFLRLPLILAAVMMLRRVDGNCVEDNCYGALYWNPAGAEECSDHFVTTVVPVPTTTTVTITSDVADLTTIKGAPIATGVIIPSVAIPTYIVRACYGDISYRFESACSCIEAGPTTTMIAQPTITDTVVFPGTGGVPPNPPVSPVVPVPPVSPVGPVSPPSPFPSPPVPSLPASGSLSSGLAQPTCVPIPGPVIVTVQVDTLYMTLTMAGSTLCLGNSTAPPAPSSGCSCPSTLPSSVPALSSSSTTLANTTSFISSGSFSTVRRTSFSGYSNTSSAAATSEEEPSSTAAPTSLVTSQTSAESTEASSTEESSVVESTSAEASSSIEEPSSTAAAESSTTAEASSTEESTTAPPSSSLVPSTTTIASSSTTGISTSATAGPTHFVPNGPTVLLQIASGALSGQYIASDPPTADRPTNLRSHTTPDVDSASVWTLDAPTGILFQKIGDDWWGAWFGFARTQWSAIQLLPADTIVSWLVTPVTARAPLRCVIDFSALNVITCGQQLWTKLMQSDKCGWAITQPFNPTYAAACPGSEELFLQAIVVSPEEEGIN